MICEIVNFFRTFSKLTFFAPSRSYDHLLVSLDFARNSLFGQTLQKHGPLHKKLVLATLLLQNVYWFYCITINYFDHYKYINELIGVSAIDIWRNRNQENQFFLCRTRPLNVFESKEYNIRP